MVGKSPSLTTNISMDKKIIMLASLYIIFRSIHSSLFLSYEPANGFTQNCTEYFGHISMKNVVNVWSVLVC